MCSRFSASAPSSSSRSRFLSPACATSPSADRQGCNGGTVQVHPYRGNERVEENTLKFEVPWTKGTEHPICGCVRQASHHIKTQTGSYRSQGLEKSHLGLNLRGLRTVALPLEAHAALQRVQRPSVVHSPCTRKLHFRHCTKWPLSARLQARHVHVKQCTSVPTRAIQASSTVALHLVQEWRTPHMFAPQQAQRTAASPNDAKVGVAAGCGRAGLARTMDAGSLKVKE